MRSHGYVILHAPDYPGADARGRAPEQNVVVWRRTGIVLRSPHEVHHANGDRADNVPPNLVVCEDRGYHLLLHQRAAALAACGHAGWKLCHYCKRYDAPERMRVHRNRATYDRWHHGDCRNAYYRERVGTRNAEA